MTTTETQAAAPATTRRHVAVSLTPAARDALRRAAARATGRAGHTVSLSDALIALADSDSDNR